MIPIQWNASDSESNYSFTTLNLKHYHRFVSPEATRSQSIIILVRTYRASLLQSADGNQVPRKEGRNGENLKQAGLPLRKEWHVVSGEWGEHHLAVTQNMAQHSLLHGSLVLHFITILDREFIATKEGCPGSLRKLGDL